MNRIYVILTALALSASFGMVYEAEAHKYCGKIKILGGWTYQPCGPHGHEEMSRIPILPKTKSKKMFFCLKETKIKNIKNSQLSCTGIETVSVYGMAEMDKKATYLCEPWGAYVHEINWRERVKDKSWLRKNNVRTFYSLHRAMCDRIFD